MTRESFLKIKHCVHCGETVEEFETYCPKCGKLIIKVKPSKKEFTPTSSQKLEISRKCSGCGSIITSTIIDQCPICNTDLERISEVRKASIKEKPGLIFTNNKLEPEQKFILKKDAWNFKEGINVFATCIYVLVIIYFLIFALVSFQFDVTDPDLNILIIVLGLIPELIFGIYPLWYIYNKKHSYRKLGFDSDSKKILKTIGIGIVGTFVLVLIEIYSNVYIDLISDAGLDFFNIKISIIEQNQEIKDAGLLWILLVTLLLTLGAISSEIVFRGILHNTLKKKFKKEYYVILLVSLANSLVVLLLSVTFGLTFFLTNFLTFTVLGALYSINGNIYNTIIAKSLYNIVIVILIVL